MGGDGKGLRVEDGVTRRKKGNTGGRVGSRNSEQRRIDVSRRRSRKSSNEGQCG